MEKENRAKKKLAISLNKENIILWTIIVALVVFIAYVMNPNLLYTVIPVIVVFIAIIEHPFIKIKFQRWWPYGWKRRGMIVAILLCFYLFLAYTMGWYQTFAHQLGSKGWFSNEYMGGNETGLIGAFHMFFKHFWIEILSGIFLYILIEKKLDKYAGMPRNNGKRTYWQVAREMAESKRGIRILDNDINSYFIGPIEENKSIREIKILKEERLDFYNFRTHLDNAVKTLDANEKIQILLLHPNSHAAHQRNNDLALVKPANFDVFESMREGLRRLNEIVTDFNDIQKYSEKYRDKIEVKLFKSTHSIVFASWDDNINFSVLPPSQIDSVETFSMAKNTPLSTYFQQHFDALWNEAVNLDDYLYVKLARLDASKRIVKKIPWGSDSFNHDLPVFISGSAFNDNDLLDEIRNDHTFQLIHDGEIRFVKIEKIDYEKNKSLYRFAQSRIRKTTELSSDADDDTASMYKLKYVHEHKISLRDGNHVNRQLGTKGYCFVPVGMYEIHIGQHVKDMLNILYKFYFKYDENYLAIQPDKADPLDATKVKVVTHKEVVSGEKVEMVVPKRIIATFYCKEYHEEFKFIDGNEGIAAFKIYAKKNSRKAKDPDLAGLPFLTSHPDLKTDILTLLNDTKRLDLADKTDIEKLIVFLASTIKADLGHILGRTEKEQYPDKHHLKPMRDDFTYIKITVHLLQIEVDASHSKSNPDANEIIENKADYTIVHSMGRKNITGGLSTIKRVEYVGSDDGHEVIEEKSYNLAVPLDTIFTKGSVKIKSDGSLVNDDIEPENPGKKVHHIKLTADTVEYLEPDGDEKEKRGYRNLIGIEVDITRASDAMKAFSSEYEKKMAAQS
ncbi:hypothetical protein [Flavobacterium sp.]|uniref:hypothetical protein n=1 Tax=Flavobacterium sp. TaxID=239 RepID=UPI00286A7AB1|nr:hypothetical protein [Flavobacterium sp.]